MRRGQYREESIKDRYCSQCGEKFRTGRQHADTCGPKCRKKKSRERAKSQSTSSAGRGGHAGSSQGQASQEQRRQPHPWDAMLDRNRRSLSLACQILGLPMNPTPANAKATWRRKVMEYHPDRGGDEQAFKHIQAAYEYLVDFYGWK